MPVLVELFTSEGCSSCPPADDVLARLETSQPVAGARIVPLAFHVDYWDDLGWPDPFAASSFTARQRAYATTGHGMYTPQAVIDGRTQLVGSYSGALENAIGKAALLTHAPVDLSVRGKSGSVDVAVHVGALPEAQAATGATVFVAVTQARASVAVARGENGGRTLTHTAIVRGLRTAGTIDATGGDVEATLRTPAGAPEAELRIVAFVQRASDHAIVGSATRRLAR